MEDKLVTLAIYTFEKAQILKTMLETEGVDVYIHNVNLIQPVISSGVRVRIKESDLPKALSIIESSQWLKEDVDEAKEAAKREKKILIPIDFSDYSLKACCFGFNYAHSIQAKVILLHTFFTPLSASAIPFGDTITPYQVDDDELISHMSEKAKADMEKFVKQIKNKIANKELPDVKFTQAIEEGVPEEEIMRYSKMENPILIIMGTRGKNKKDLDLIGSVTAEVIEMSRVPVFAVPENTHFSKIEEIQKIAFATSFDQKDLVAFDNLMKVVRYFGFEVYFIHVSEKADAWDEVKLAGIKEYFKKQYPALKSSYHIIDSSDTLVGLDNFIKKNQIDVLALSNHKRNLFSRLFNPSIARKMIFHSDTPLLVLKA